MTGIRMSKPVYWAIVGHDPDELPYMPIYTSSLGIRCDFCGQRAKVEVLILPEFDLRLACAECEWRENNTFIDEDYEGWTVEGAEAWKRKRET